jgi:hypothetical protein
VLSRPPLSDNSSPPEDAALEFDPIELGGATSSLSNSISALRLISAPILLALLLFQEFINPIFLENPIGAFWWEECLLDYEQATSNVYLIRLPKNFGIIPRFYYKWLGDNTLMLNDIVTEESFYYKIPNE